MSEKSTAGFASTLVILVIWLIPLLISFYGLVLCFQASIVLGFVALLIEPSPLIFGLLGIFGHSDIPQRIATGLGL